MKRHTDHNYRDAINYDGTNYYHAPMTITIKDVLYILPFGTADNQTLRVIDRTVYIIGVNRRLDDSICMVAIDLDNSSIEECNISSNDVNDKDCSVYKIHDKDITEQIKILSNYLPY
jgi:hypothetical protein